MIRKKILLFSPILLSLSYIFTLFYHNIGELFIDRLILPVIWSIGITLIIIGVSYLLFRQISKTESFSYMLLGLFLTYGAFHDVVNNLFYMNEIQFIVWIILIVILFFVIKKSKRGFTVVNKFLRIVSLITLMISILNIGAYEANKHFHPTIEKEFQISNIEKNNIKADELPDIYYLLPDSYSAPSIFSKYFDYDNTDFSKYLTDKGFYVVDHATSNYPKTFLSLSSTLTMGYLDKFSIYKDSSDQTLVAPLILNSNVLNILKHLGYKYYQLGSWWWPSNYNPHADKNYILEGKNRLRLDSFSYILVESTMIKPVIEKLAPRLVIGESDDDKRELTQYQFSKLSKIADLKGPKFVFAHIISPHGPYVLDEMCNPINWTDIQNQKVELSYTNQVQCINKKLKETIDVIQKNKDRPQVILIQSDEGAPFLAGRLTPPDNWKEASDLLLNQKFPILSALYLPRVSHDSLYKTMTPVNSFRIIFNLYFNANLPLLPDKNYILPDMDHLYDFKEVTEKIKN